MRVTLPLSHAVIKLLALVFTLSAVYNLKIWGKLIPSRLFSGSADPGLLTIDFDLLFKEVQKVMKQMPSVADVRALSMAELWMPDVMDN